MGIGYDEFWLLNRRKINVMLEGYKLRKKVKDEEAWMLGGYVFHAVSVSLGNAFRKKNTKAQSYFEVLEKPFLSSVGNDSGELSEEEKQKYRDALMASLNVMQNNFNRTHGK